MPRIANSRRLSLLLASCLVAGLWAQSAAKPSPRQDRDHDGLSDALEQRLLQQFLPHFLVAEHDCALRPARFQPGRPQAAVLRRDGTIYGQAFPAPAAPDGASRVELHYYDLWASDCGPEGHPLDAEHVAALVQAPPTGADTGWTAVVWFAAAHENTVCDVSQFEAAAPGAAGRGPRIWISAGKHAAFLAPRLAAGGCGADKLPDMAELDPPAVINLGEPGAPLNGARFAAAPQWPLAAKMRASDFPPALLARLQAMPPGAIAWVHPGRHPAQGVIAVSDTTAQAILGGEKRTGDALSTAADATGNGAATAQNSTGNALARSGRAVWHALGHAAGFLFGHRQPGGGR